MNNTSQVYFQFKDSPQILIGQPVYLKDVAYISCPEELRVKLDNIEILATALEKNYAIRAVDIIQLISNKDSSLTVNLLGKENILIEPRDKSAEPSGIRIFITVLFSSILLFVGAGLAIMYFHEDVNMNQVHRVIYTMITGIKEERPLIISIPYSLGLGIGIAIFFDVFSLDKKKGKPGPLEIELYKYNKDIEDYKISTRDSG